ncbi:branched-chain amino acid ABC transporter permease [Aliishimia ponticola]|uniref:Branched-chain amino acid ABC transporter permease n=1 Tax=Aliishimia ponticola TaxID=2499833 RepID=A0A4S4ND79_9RHOB|nr:branched-chain amino acid ABC transporter permease [Aliishimia ponticola]THH36715.1 branched-chain amino acid ABC transporter permease [Aliishimia ponticola]
MTEDFATDPTKPAQRLRAGSLTIPLIPWLIAGALVIVMPLFFQANSAITIMNQMAITIIFALAYNMLLGQGGMLSFGHAVYMGVGGFATVHIMNMSDFFAMLPLPVMPIFGGLVGMVLAMIVGSFSTRSAGTVFAMISLGVGELIAACSVIIVVFFGGEEGISGDRTYGLPFFGIEFLQQIEVYYLIAFWLMVSAALMYLFSRTPVGRMANAVRDNPERAEFLGYSARWVRFYSFVASGFFAGIAGALFAINYEILTEENLNLTTSGLILLVTFLGGAGFFFGPVLGAIVFTLVQTVLSLETELWGFYAGILFVATVMYFPGGLAGLIMMHVPALRLGKAGRLIVPYLKTLIPGLFTVLGASALIEMIFHYRHAAVGDDEMTLFWTSFDSHSALPWIVAIAVTVVGFWLTKKTAPDMAAAWHDANSPDGGAA